MLVCPFSERKSMFKDINDISDYIKPYKIPDGMIIVQDVSEHIKLFVEKKKKKVKTVDKKDRGVSKKIGKNKTENKNVDNKKAENKTGNKTENKADDNKKAENKNDTATMILKTADKVPFINQALYNGDYSILGLENLFTIERKMISDFLAYIGKERNIKTVHKLGRFKHMINRGGWVGLIIEAAEEELMKGSIYSKITPEMIRQSLISMRVRWGIHVYFNPDRDYLKRFVVDHAIKFWNVWHGK